jgi:Mannosylglycerate hydrolase MGH1-like glycoside hydrolase domain
MKRRDFIGLLTLSTSGLTDRRLFALPQHRASMLAGHFGRTDETERHMTAFQALRRSINNYLWDEAQDAYFNHDVKEGERRPRLICTTFDPLRLGIAPTQRVAGLIDKLLDPRLFNWGKLPVTSIAKTASDYMEGTGPYNGTQWFGDVWAMRNAFIVEALEDAGRHDLATELTWATIKAFSGNYAEYLLPSTGKGDGVRRYAWSASLYIASVIEHLFGVDYDRIQGRVRILPRVPKELAGKEISLAELKVPAAANTRLSVTVRQMAAGQAHIAVDIRGTLPVGEMEILLPNVDGRPPVVRDGEDRKLPVLKELGGLANVTGVRVSIRNSIRLRFE